MINRRKAALDKLRLGARHEIAVRLNPRRPQQNPILSRKMVARVSDIVIKFNEAWKSRLTSRPSPERPPAMDVGAFAFTANFHQELDQGTAQKSGQQIPMVVVNHMRKNGRSQFADYLAELFM